MKLFRKEEGFTLVELMVVVLIIGILVAIAIPVFNAASASARKSACQANLRTIDGATEQYLAASPNNTRAQVDADPETTLSPYVKDWAKSSTCPVAANGAYGVANGDFSCDDNAHNYENN